MKHPLTTILIDLLRKCVCCAGAVTELFLVDRVAGGVQLIISIHYPAEMATSSISLWPSSLTKSDLRLVFGIWVHIWETRTYRQIQDVLGCHGQACMRFHEDLHWSPANVRSVPIRRIPRPDNAHLAATMDHCHHLFSRFVLLLGRQGPQLNEGLLCHSNGRITSNGLMLADAIGRGLHPRARLLLRTSLLLASASHVERHNDKANRLLEQKGLCYQQQIVTIELDTEGIFDSLKARIYLKIYIQIGTSINCSIKLNTSQVSWIIAAYIQGGLGRGENGLGCGVGIGGRSGWFGDLWLCEWWPCILCMMDSECWGTWCCQHLMNDTLCVVGRQWR